MSFDLKNSSEQDEFSNHYSSRYSLLTEINMTPFVDICLVLLIIFMITAPFAISGVNIQLPSAKTQSLKVSEESIIVSINKEGEFYFKKKKIALENLSNEIKKITKDKKNLTLYIRADKDALYQKVMDAMTAAKQAGVEKIGMMNKNN
ncbi:MAG: biopolymer transporter ExbD [Silvanigrellaceae bacterium]|nr:biopolymer transporter ExbD [Silvanigrellaceae bacterium]